MGISQLPKIEIPTEEALADEDKHILDAFKILLNGYQRSQARVRAILKAYSKLESIATSLLEERNRNDESSAKIQEAPLIDNIESKCSSLPLQENVSREDVLMVDLTHDFEFSQQSVDTMNRVKSPVFGHQRKRSRKNGCSEEESPEFKDIKQKVEKIKEFSPKIVTNQEESLLEYEAADENEENTPPLCSSKTSDIPGNDSTLCLNTSMPVAKIGLNKAVYNVDLHKTPSGKRSKQLTLVFKPQTSKMDLSCSEKQFAKPSISRKWDDLFDEDYRIVKKPASPEKYSEERQQESLKTVAKGLTEKESALVLTSKTSVTTSKVTPKSDKNKMFNETPAGRRELSFVIETPSQIDETARSLFDDEDLDDDFDVSKDLLNTCMDSPVIIDNGAQPVTPSVLRERSKSIAAIPSTSKASESLHVHDSIDETFFAPGETEIEKNDAGRKGDANSKLFPEVAKANFSRDKDRNFKRKFGDETQFKTGNELDDFGVDDFDWDVDITKDVCSPPKRPLDDSFDMVPEKKKKSPNYAYKGKIVRSKSERAKLRGWSCKDCENYYGNMNLPEEELRRLMDRCSRHRSKYNQKYITQKDFWNPLFPDTTDSSDFSQEEPPFERK